MYVIVYRGRDQAGADVVMIVCVKCGYNEQHFAANGEAKRGKPCDRCRK